MLHSFNPDQHHFRVAGPGELTVLDEANVLGVAAETLPAAHQPILPDQSMGVSTDPADAGAGPVVLGVGVPDVGVPHLLVRLPPAAAGC